MDRIPDEQLLDILACPLCKEKVVLQDEVLVCNKCNRHYPVRDGIPIMITNEALQHGSSGSENRSAEESNTQDSENRKNNDAGHSF